MQRSAFLTLLFSLFIGFVKAQVAENNQATTLQGTPYHHIKSLQEGILLVRLKTAQQKIDALNKLGKTDWAQKIIREQKAENQRIINAFKQHYTFSPVYFFYSDDSH